MGNCGLLEIDSYVFQWPCSCTVTYVSSYITSLVCPCVNLSANKICVCSESYIFHKALGSIRLFSGTHPGTFDFKKPKQMA